MVREALKKICFFLGIIPKYSIMYSHLIVKNPLIKWWVIRMLELKVWCILRSIDEIPSRLSCGCLLRSSKYLGWGRDVRWTVNHKIIILAFSFNKIAILAFNFKTVTKPVFCFNEFITLAFSIHFNKIINHSIQTLELHSIALIYHHNIWFE